MAKTLVVLRSVGCAASSASSSAACERPKRIASPSVSPNPAMAAYRRSHSSGNSPTLPSSRRRRPRRARRREQLRKRRRPAVAEIDVAVQIEPVDPGGTSSCMPTGRPECAALAPRRASPRSRACARPRETAPARCPGFAATRSGSRCSGTRVDAADRWPTARHSGCAARAAAARRRTRLRPAGLRPRYRRNRTGPTHADPGAARTDSGVPGDRRECADAGTPSTTS